MQESQNFTPDTGQADHGITIHASNQRPPRHEALCLCGFASELFDDRRRAVQAGRHHVEAVSPVDDSVDDAIAYIPASAVADTPALVAKDIDDLALEVAVGEPDPFMTPCPSWCSDIGGYHPVAGSDDDRIHCGGSAAIPLRHLRATYFPAAAGAPASYTLGYFEGYLRQAVDAAKPTIRVDASGSNVGVDLTLDEADAIGRALLAMVQAAG